jgi:hypothetical protein
VLSRERDQLATDNQRLSEHVGDLTAQLDSAKKELKAMAKVQVELQVGLVASIAGAAKQQPCSAAGVLQQARQPDVERLITAALQREQAAQEDRNRKVLQAPAAAATLTLVSQPATCTIRSATVCVLCPPHTT